MVSNVESWWSGHVVFDGDVTIRDMTSVHNVSVDIAGVV